MSSFLVTLLLYGSATSTRPLHCPAMSKLCIKTRNLIGKTVALSNKSHFLTMTWLLSHQSTQIISSTNPNPSPRSLPRLRSRQYLCSDYASVYKCDPSWSDNAKWGWLRRRQVTTVLQILHVRQTLIDLHIHDILEKMATCIKNWLIEAKIDHKRVIIIVICTYVLLMLGKLLKIQ